MDSAGPIASGRTAAIERRTLETDIRLSLALDGQGTARIDTGIGFFDHMLTAWTRHAGFDLTLAARGDLHVDGHHTVEDCGLALGTALRQAAGDGAGIVRFGQALLPMDEALIEAAVDWSGRPFLAWSVRLDRPMLGGLDTELLPEFFRALATEGRFTLHVCARSGSNAHHRAEAAFKAVARALRMALALDPRISGVPSTKGVL